MGHEEISPQSWEISRARIHQVLFKQWLEKNMIKQWKKHGLIMVNNDHNNGDS